MSNFDNDPRRQQELRCRPYADKIYQKAFGKIEIIRDSDIVLDRDFAIDVRIITPNGLNLLGQEKFLSMKYASFNSVTIEYHQNQFTKEPGDWFRMGVQFYFVGYENGNSFAPYVLLDWTKVVLHSNNSVINWRMNANKNGKAKASFVWTRMNEFPQDCIILKG